ncbi:hypothetical protein BKA69DRAFT_1087362 [Paraphysoderma sedebokerense]|nr:hypothetical protein BKA69DRAFT_1087362 [Paraphysoderma sedebokerense]
MKQAALVCLLLSLLASSVSADPLAALYKVTHCHSLTLSSSTLTPHLQRNANAKCQETIKQFRNDACYVFKAPTEVSPKTLKDTYGSYTTDQCSTACADKTKTYAKDLIANCVNGYADTDANAARAVISATLYARDMACTKDDNNQYCLNNILETVDQVANTLKKSVKIDTCGDKTTVIIQPFDLGELPDNFACTTCIKKFVVGSYGWMKMLNDKLGNNFYMNGIAQALKFPEWSKINKFADDLNAKCKAPVVNKDYPIQYPTGDAKPSSTATSATTTASATSTTTASATPSAAPSTVGSTEGNGYYKNTPGYIPGDTALGESSTSTDNLPSAAGSVSGSTFALVAAAGAGFLAFL